MILLAILLAASALLQAGCASPPKNQLAPGHGGGEARRILVFPMNIFLSLPEGVGEGADRVALELERYLADHGKQVERVEYRVARRAWLRAVRAAKRAREGGVALSSTAGLPLQLGAKEGESEEGFALALAQLAPVLARQHDFDALLIPAIVPRKAVLTGRRVRWDGVSRPLEFGRMPQTGDGILWSDPVMGRMEMAAPSLWSVVVLPDGTRIFEGVGGLDVTVRAEFVNATAQRAYDLQIAFVPVDEPFRDADVLREGVALALAPYLPYWPDRPAPTE